MNNINSTFIIIRVIMIILITFARQNLIIGNIFNILLPSNNKLI